MQSREYRDIIARIVRNTVKKELPGIKRATLEDIGKCVAIAIHARMYGANVDGVDSPIWSDPCKRGQGGNGEGRADTPSCPNVDASELIKNGENDAQ